jgi:hypothetical protein
MSLILAIEPDRRQAVHLTTLARGPLNVELVVGDTTERAFEELGPRVPDLVLTSLLLSPKDETALAERLRELDAAGAHVQTLVIPVLGSEGGARKRSGGGLFGRLRRSADQERPSEGCDPAVFGAQISEYLDRAAAERAALAAAQADLEAAWAEVPPPVRSAEPSLAAESAESPESLFGEFASVPMGTVALAGDEAPAPPPYAAADFSNRTEAELASAPQSTPSVAPSGAAGAAAHGDEDWEEIALDVSAAAEAHHGPVDAHNDLTAEAVDLDAFVHELHTVETTANALPMIPVVDLTGRSLDRDVDPVRHNDETVSAIFQAAEPALDLGDELERAPLATETAEQPVARLWEQAFEPNVAAESFTFEAAEEAIETVAPETSEAAVVSVDAVSDWSETIPVEARAEAVNGPTAEQTAAALEAEIASVPRPSAVEAPTAPQAGWQDLLSAIRRDLSHMKTEEPAPEAQPRPELDLSKEPLVFPIRPVLTASAIAEAMPVRPERLAAAEYAEGPMSSHAAHKLEASLQASLLTRLALTPEPMAPASGSEVSERQAAIEAQLANAIKTSATEISQPRVAEPVQTAPGEGTIEGASEQAAEPIWSTPDAVMTAAIDAADAFAAEDPGVPAAGAEAATDVSAAEGFPLDAFPAETAVTDELAAELFAADSEIFAADVEAVGLESRETYPTDSSVADAMAAAFTIAALHTGDPAQTEASSAAEPVPIEPEVAFVAGDPVIAEFEHALEAGGGSSEMPVAAVQSERADWDAEDAVHATEGSVPVPAVRQIPVAPAAPRRERKERGPKHKRKRRQEQAPTAVSAAGPRIASWGFFDPQQVGFGSLVAKLNEVTRRGPDSPRPR